MMFLTTRKPRVAAACSGLSERSRALVLEALDNGSVLVWWPGNTDAVHLVDIGLLETPSTFTTAFPVTLTVPAKARRRLERDRSKLLGDIPPSRRRKLIG